MFLKVGDRVRHSLTGKVYQLKRIVDEWALLEEENRRSQILTGLMEMHDSYEKLDRLSGEAFLLQTTQRIIPKTFIS